MEEHHVHVGHGHEREECRDCRGSGRVVKSYNPHEVCPWCEGEGFVPVGSYVDDDWD